MLSAVERRTLAFYDWELHGRGWHHYVHPVALEPPVGPYRRVDTNDQLAIDDARHHTWFSALWESVVGLKRTAEPDHGEASVRSPRPSPETRTLVERQIILDNAQRMSVASFQAWLESLGTAREPIALEFVGSAETVQIQLVTAESDGDFVTSALSAFFPRIGLTTSPRTLASRWDESGEASVILECGLAREFMLPLKLPASHPDPLTAIFAALSGIPEGEIAVVQVLFQELADHWPESILRAVTTPRGEAFFEDAPELTVEARRKVSQTLFGVALRLGVNTRKEDVSWNSMRRLVGGLGSFGGGGHNALIPLASSPTALNDLLERTSHRAGFILNTEELSALVHLPTEPLPGLRGKRATRERPADLRAGHLFLGTNHHHGVTHKVWLSEEKRLQHIHVIGSSGSGKSTLLLRLITEDMEKNRGLAVIDPHGDLVEEVLARVPKSRLDDVVLLDPAQESYVVGWNVVSAETETERDILSSDMVAVFKRLSTSWGDQMTTVLASTLDVFLQVDGGGTLADVRQFLINGAFREKVLAGLKDDYLLSYWREEFPLLLGKKPQAPILTRLSTFLRSRIVRRTVTGCFRHQVLLRRDRHVHDGGSGRPTQVSEHPHVGVKPIPS